MRFFDTFTGIGGFTIPLLERGFECVGYSEVDRYASSIYQHHFPTHHNYGDITRIDAATLPDFDLLCGGFPCQAFSVAGKRRGFLDTRGTLFFDVCRIAKEKRPRLLLLENVKGLLNHDGGETFRVILSALDELGYDAEWQVCNSRHFGVPQNRERVYIVGHLRGERRPEVFPLGDGDCQDCTQDVREAEGLYTGTISLKNQSGQCQFDSGTTLIETTAPHPAVAIDMKATKGSTRRGTVKEGYTGALDGDCAQAVSIYPGHKVNDAAGIASTLKAGTHGVGGGEVLVNTGAMIRRLTPVECERLQAYPDGWTAAGTNGPISDTQRYKCLGNAVTVNVVREIVARLEQCRHEPSSSSPAPGPRNLSPL